MSAKSTRGKIKEQAKKAVADMDRCMEHLQACYEIAGGRSAFIDEHLPLIVTGIEGLQVILKQYEEML